MDAEAGQTWVVGGQMREGWMGFGKTQRNVLGRIDFLNGRGLATKFATRLHGSTNLCALSAVRRTPQ